MSDQIHRLNAALAGRYAIERELGHGGMAVVYLARDLKHDRHVALKVLRPELAASIGPDRFLREVQITAKLTHPHILMLIDSGEADGALYYVMPFVEGESLRDRINREKQLPLEDALRITREVGDALQHAHNQGVIHRDIKPENILFEAGHAVVADFGIARAVSEAVGERLTDTGLAVGTPAYMSPEQATGEAELDARSDVYSLGCVLYEMLAGDAPFTGSTAQAILARKVTEAPPILTTVRDAVPGPVEAAVRKALARVPADRYATAQELVQALAAPAAAPPRRVGVPVIAAAAVALVVVGYGALGGRLGLVRPAAAAFFDAEDRVLVADFVNETDAPALALAIREAIETDLHQSTYANVVERTALGEVLSRMRLSDSTGVPSSVAVEIAQREGYRAVIAGGVTPLGAGYQVTAQIIEPETGEVAVRLRETAAGEVDVLRAVERIARLARRHLGESLASLRSSRPLPQVTTGSLDALQLYARGREAHERGQVEAAISLMNQAVRVDSTFAAAYRALGIYQGNLGNTGAAQANIDKAYRYSDRLPRRERYLIGAGYHSYRGRLDSAAHYYALVIDHDPADYVALNNLGDVYERMGRYEEALELYQQAGEAAVSTVSLLNIASAARTLGRHEVADSALSLLQDRSPNTWMTWQTEAGNALYAGRFDQLSQIAGDMSRHQFPFPRAYGRWLLASLAAMHGQIRAAIALADTASALAAEAGSAPFEYLALVVAEVAALAGGKPELAVPVLDAARDPAYASASPMWQNLQLGFLANGYALAGDSGRARHLLIRMDSVVRAEGVHPFGIGDHVGAVLALASGHPDEAVVHLERSRSRDYGLHHNISRLLLADAYTSLGRLEEAAAHYDSLTVTHRLSFIDMGYYGPLRPIAHERAGNTYLALGDTVRAVEHLSAFVDLWREADPALQPVVTQTRRRLAELVGEPRSSR